ncbi:MAG: hypothetical protein GX361_03835 [Bacteroidales bacterium]|mgnify:CR=1 FL=1|nr:hypothetical protein [Bacteroidales bacterium]
MSSTTISQKVERYETTLNQVKQLKRLKKNFNDYNPGVVSYLLESLKSDLLEEDRVLRTIPDLILKAPPALIELRDRLIVEVDLLLIEKGIKDSQLPNKPAEKHELTFEGLFEKKYRHKISDLINVLKRCSYIDENEKLISKFIDFARIFYYLIENNVIQKEFYRGSDGISVFYDKFGCKVVEKKEKNVFCAVRGGITRNTARNTDLIENYVKEELTKYFI